MTKIKYITVFILSLFILSCNKIKKPINDSEANDPIYLLKGLVDGDSLLLYVNDTTVFINNAPHDMNGVLAYSSTISNIETNFELKLIVVRPEIYIDEAGLKLIKNGKLDFIVHKPICKKFNFLLNNINQSVNFNATINSEAQNDPQFWLDGYGKYNASFKFPNINNKTYDLPFEVGFKDQILDPSFVLDSVNYNHLSFDANNLNLNHIWKINDTIISDTTYGEIQLTNGIHKIEHSITDLYNNTARKVTYVYFENNQLAWYIKDDFCSYDFIENNYGNIIIEVVKDGVKYISSNNPKNLLNTLTVSEIEYVIDSNTQLIKYIKFNIKFDAELKSLDNSKLLKLKDMEGTFHIEIN